ncbi:helix-turn-helix transcriptional regulator [Salinactinospora qingdaonensis]|uniref:HTH luxR-type domain-containing protein n=1 Tax=Salinactinospora qingdaonensis TaxID=702744 RepID=A0ABP7GA89_9ACTN
MAPHSAPAWQSLPLEPNSFIGRERDLNDLLRLLRTNRVVTLCGVGGIGKTRLALRLAARATGQFADGVWLTELADVTHREQVVSRIAAAVGVTEENDRNLGGTLRDALRPRRMLLVLDNCEHVIEDVAALCRLLLADCPGVSLVLTSREPARLTGEAVWRVPPLAVPHPDSDDPADSEAVRLFIHRARSGVHDFAVTAERLRIISDICRRLDGIPLAIELAAARTRLLSPQQIAARIDDRFRFLTNGDRNAPPRQQTLRAVIDWSYEMLSEPERVLLRRLSVFSGWDLEGAEQVCADATLPEADILDLLSSLTDRSLVTVVGESGGRVRYRLLDTIRHYAATRLTESGEEERIRLRHRLRMGRLADELAGKAVLGGRIPWSQRWEVWYRVVEEYDNLRVALSWSAARGEGAEGLRLCLALRPFWIVGGHFAEGSQWTDRFLAMEQTDTALWGRAMVQRAELAWEQKDHRHAKTVAEEGLRRCRATGSTSSVTIALNILAMMDMRDQLYERARLRLSEALALSRAESDLWNEGIARGTLGAVAKHIGDLDEAIEQYETALDLLRGIDHRWGVARTLIGRGVVAEVRGELGDAEECYREALGIQRDLEALPELARCLAGVGRIAARRGATVRAYTHLSEALLLSHSTGQRIGVARGLAAIARVARGDGLAADACRLGGAAEAIREVAGFPALKPILFTAAETVSVDPDAVTRWWSEGRALSLDEAVNLALGVTEGHRVPPPRDTRAPYPPQATSPLTRREHEVALLVAEGLSNRGIGGRLFISPATVARHIANINTKLGFHSRTQIAAYIDEYERTGVEEELSPKRGERTGETAGR